MNLRDDLPPSLRNRFDSLGGFVNAVINEESNKEDKIPRSQKQFIQAIVFITALHRFLTQGAQAAKDTLTELKEHGITSFAIGSARFAEGSEDLERGSILAKELVAAVSDPKIRSYLSSDKSLTQIVKELRSHVSNA